MLAHYLPRWFALLVFAISPMIALAGGGELPNGSSVSGSITNDGTLPIPSDSWTFKGKAGDFAYIAFVVTNSPKGATLCLNLQLPDGTTVGCAYGSTALNSLTQTGTYTVKVVWGSGPVSTVSYSMMLAEAGSTFAGSPVSNGSPVSGSLANGGTVAEYTSYIPAGVSFYASVGTASSSPVGLGLGLQIADPNGKQLLSGFYTDFNNLNSVTSIGGDYRFILYRSDSTSRDFLSSADYKFTVAVGRIPASLAGGEAMVGTTSYSGSMGHGVLDQWPFTALAGQAVTISIAARAGNPSGAGAGFNIFGPNGAKLLSGYTPTYTFTPATTGPYRVVIYRDDAGSGPYFEDVLYTLTLTNGGLYPDNGAAAQNGLTCPRRCSDPNQPDEKMQAAQALAITQGPNSSRPAGGEPIDIATGNLAEDIEDYSTAGQNPLAFIRYYNSLAVQNSTPVASSLGVNWRHNYDRSLIIQSPTNILAERPDGSIITFAASGGVWRTSTDTDMTLTGSGAAWVLTDGNDTQESYTASGSVGQLQQIVLRNGYTQILSYSSGLLSTVSDSYGRSLVFTYNGNLLETVTTPDSLVLTYGMTAAAGSHRLTSVFYNTSPATSVAYLYEDSRFPFALTGVTDENGGRYLSWSYDGMGRAATSQNGDGSSFSANLYAIAYDDSTGNRTLTGPLVQQVLYKFKTLNGVYKLTEADRLASAGVPAATRSYAYDGNGYLNSWTDWSGNGTTFVNNAQGNPTTINEGVVGGTPARTTTIAYDATWPRLPHSIVTPGLTTTLNHEAATGNLLTRTLTDTTTGTVPYATTGQARTTTYGWTAYGLLASVKGPRTDLDTTTKFSYDSSGALTKITNALGQSVQITQHTPGGLPQTIVDANGVTTQFAYDPRQRLTGRTVTTAAGALKTAYTLDAAGNLTGTTLPDGSSLTGTFDVSHRLTQLTDALGNSIKYTLDAQGDRTETDIDNAAGTLTQQSFAKFDSLGRDVLDTAGDGQTVSRSFDPNSNALTVTDGLGNTTTNAYEALNRLSSSQDANGGVTKLSYDSHDRLIGVQDANGNTTSYVRDGFGDVIQQVSPDSGTAVFHFDGDGNQTGKTDAHGIVTNQTFDALDRILTTVYSASAAENVSRIYDQAGTGFAFGIGRLTSVTDAAGSLSRTYDEQGNLTLEKRVNGTTTLSTGYGYDKANRVASIGYPDGTLVTYARDAAGYITTVSAKPARAASTVQLATLTHAPFGPMDTATFGNGVAETWTLNLAYRPTNITDMLSGAALQNLTYAYDLAANVKSITDAVNPANTQSFAYDPLNRLKSASSGAGGYGSFSWTYDNVGNRLTQTQGTTNTVYGYMPGTNRLATITVAAPQAALHRPQRVKPTESAGTVSAQGGPRVLAHALLPTGPPRAGPMPPSRLAVAIGCPLLLIGFAGIAAFRRRLLNERLLGLAVLAFLLSGSLSILIGCGGGKSKKTVATPTFSPAAGTFTSAQSVTISDATASATIYYTTDGTTPTTSSTKYTAPIAVASTETIKAIAVASGDTDSAVASATYTINVPPPVAAKPTFSPGAGTYSSAQSVTIADATAGATIYYTTDGTTPTTSSTKYTSPIAVVSTTTIEAIAAASGYTDSAVATATYTISVAALACSTVTTNANGNITGVPSGDGSSCLTFTYDNANRPASVTGGPLAASFVYGYAGQRFSKTNGGMSPTVYSYGQDGAVLAENDGGTVTDYVYADGRPIAVLQPAATPAANQVNYVLADHLGTPQRVTNSGGAVVWNATYQPFGATAGTVSAAITQNLRFPGQLADGETGFNYNLYRDYMPNLGRYLESDPIGLAGGQISTYIYAWNNSPRNTDPPGLGICYYNSNTGQLMCVSTIPGGGGGFSGQFSSGNNNIPGCHNNPACESIPDVGPIPTGKWEWNPNEYTSKGDAYALDPIDVPTLNGRNHIETHSCLNPNGPHALKGRHVCSEGCVTSTAQTVQQLNNFLEQEWNAGQNNFLFVNHPVSIIPPAGTTQ